MTDKISSEDFVKTFGGGAVEPRIEYGTDGQPYKLSMTSGKEYERPQGEKEPVFKSVPTYRNYEDYHDAEQYTRGWNDAMRFIFGIEDK